MRRILKAVLVMGLSSVVMLLFSALRAKFVALELGPTGVGILGIVLTSVVLASTALGAGLGASGVRAVAAATEGGEGGRAVAPVAVARGSVLLALFAGPVVAVGWWFWGDLIVPQPPASALAPWVAVAVVASIGTAGTSALLNGQGRIGALAASTALGSAVGTLFFLGAMQLSHRWGLISAFAAVPVATLLIGAGLAWSTYPHRTRVPGRLWVPELRRMLLLGLAVSSSVIFTNATQVISRVWVSRQIDLVHAGYLQACLAVGAAYLGFVLTALGAEYYPRISALHRDRELLNRAANDQMRIVLILGGPVIVWMIAAAPWLLRLLYSSEFQVADSLLRLLLVGDVFKLIGWCVGFLMLAQEAKLKFFVAELSWNTFFLAVLIPLAHRGLAVAGIAYLTAYVLYAIVSLGLARHETGFVLAPRTTRAILWVSVATVVTFAAAESRSDLGLAIALATALGCTVLAATRLLTWSRHEQESAVSVVPLERFKR